MLSPPEAHLVADNTAGSIEARTSEARLTAERLVRSGRARTLAAGRKMQRDVLGLRDVLQQAARPTSAAEAQQYQQLHTQYRVLSGALRYGLQSPLVPAGSAFEFEYLPTLLPMLTRGE